MAVFKYFSVTNEKTNDVHLVRAPKESLAIAVIAGGVDAIRLASHDDISAHYANGGTLHEKSCEKGIGKLFVKAVETGNILIRAKSQADAFSQLSDGVHTAKLADQETLVAMLQSGIKPVSYIEPVKPAKKTVAPEPSATGTNGDGAEAHTNGDTAATSQDIANDDGDADQADEDNRDAANANPPEAVDIFAAKNGEQQADAAAA